jgi:hypothetical protein
MELGVYVGYVLDVRSTRRVSGCVRSARTERDGTGIRWDGWHNLGGSTLQVKRHFTTVKYTAICPDANKLRPSVVVVVVGTETAVQKDDGHEQASERRQNAWDWMRSKLKQSNPDGGAGGGGPRWVTGMV